MLKLHPYQKKAIEFCHLKKRVYLQLDIGMGKTVISLLTVQKDPRPTIVLAPLKVCYNVWPEEIEKWCPDTTYTILHGLRKKDNIRLKKDIYILNYDGIKWFYNTVRRHKAPVMNLIIDESANIANASTKRFKLLKALLPMFRRYKLALSATPSPNSLMDLWSQYYILDGGRALYTVKNRYAKKFFTYNPYTYKYYVIKHMREKIYERIAPITYRLSSKDYLSLPPVTYNRIALTLPKQLQKRYHELERDFFIQADEGGIDAFNAASLSSKLRQFVQGGMYYEEKRVVDPRPFWVLHTEKVDKLKELMVGAAGQPILGAIQFKFEYELIKRHIGKVPIIYGKTPTKTANRYLRQWNQGELPLLLVHPASISEGVNLQAGGHLLVWMAIPYSLRHWIQLNGRLIRQGQKNPVIIHMITFRDTIDDRVWKVLTDKNVTQEDLLNAMAGRRTHASDNQRSEAIA